VVTGDWWTLLVCVLDHPVKPDDDLLFCHCPTRSGNPEMRLSRPFGHLVPQSRRGMTW